MLWMNGETRPFRVTAISRVFDGKLGADFNSRSEKAAHARDNPVRHTKLALVSLWALLGTRNLIKAAIAD